MEQPRARPGMPSSSQSMETDLDKGVAATVLLWIQSLPMLIAGCASNAATTMPPVTRTPSASRFTATQQDIHQAAMMDMKDARKGVFSESSYKVGYSKQPHVPVCIDSLYEPDLHSQGRWWRCCVFWDECA